MNREKVLDFLIAAIASAPPAALAEGTEEPFSESDWDGWVERASIHGIAPYLLESLKAKGLTPAVPESVMQKLEEIRYATAMRNTLIYLQLSQVVQMLHRAGIPVVLLKGVYLARFVYEDSALRPMGDIDLLVKEADLLEAGELMLKAGYTQNTSLSFEEQRAHHFHLEPFCKRGAIPVELHHNLVTCTSSITVDPERLWERAHPVEIDGQEALCLSPEDLLVHLCLHAFGHHDFCAGLKSLCDVSEVVRRCGDRLEWRLVESHSREWGSFVHRCVRFMLYLSRELMAVPVPDHFIEEFESQPSLSRLMVAGAKEELFGGKPVPPEASPNMAGTAFVWWHTGLLHKTAFFLRRLFPAPEEMAQLFRIPPGSKRVYWYYPIRIKDVFARHFLALFPLLRGEKQLRDLAQREHAKRTMWDWLQSPER